MGKGNGIYDTPSSKCIIEECPIEKKDKVETTIFIPEKQLHKKKKKTLSLGASIKARFKLNKR